MDLLAVCLDFSKVILNLVPIEKGPHPRFQVALRRARFDGGNIFSCCVIKKGFYE